MRRVDEPPGGSISMTSAPKSENIREQYWDAMLSPRSTTRMLPNADGDFSKDLTLSFLSVDIEKIADFVADSIERKHGEYGREARQDRRRRIHHHVAKRLGDG
jgi:hypothetical protein